MSYRIRYFLMLMSVVLLAGMGGCPPDAHLIIEGVYVSPSNDESVSVAETQVRFHIRGGGLRQDRILDHTYPEYTVMDDGEIRPGPMTSDDAAAGVGWFDWYWDGENIVQKDPRATNPANLVRTFTRKR
jgi:hypothetical protein